MRLGEEENYLEVEYVISFSLGRASVGNLQILCRKSNLEKRGNL